LSSPIGRVSSSVIGTFFNPRSFIFDQTSCSQSPGRQTTTSRVVTNEMAVMQLAP
jgi:hypothetical protein